MLRRPNATVTQSKVPSGNGRCSAREHPVIDVGEPDLAARPGPARQRQRQVAAAGGDIQHPLARAHARDRHGEGFPQPVQPQRHQVVHQVVAWRYQVEHPPHPRALVVLGNALVAEVGVGHM
jgi:hypothetical protein